MESKTIAKRNLALETARLTEITAIAASNFLGVGDEQAADQAAIHAMHKSMSTLDFDGTIRIGEGAQGEVNKLFVGEKIGTGKGPKMDVGVVALEGKSIVARGGPNAITAIAMADDGGLLTVPNVYMEKISVGPGLPEGIVDLDNEPKDNLNALAQAKGVRVSDLLVCMLDRPRHGKLIAKIRETKARIRLISDGDVIGVIATSQPEAGVDMFLGIGSAPQGVIAAAALRGIRGQMQGRFILRNNEDRSALEALGIETSNHKYSAEELASGNVSFAATGVTHSDILEGVRQIPDGIATHSMVWRSMTGTVRFIHSSHTFQQEQKHL